ncbi:MAG: hypothetical protein FD128_2064 [Hyphomonadaceae bacterium]|nr:MAG: hypothetical protein FD128_2064 [Hyphomonadaceae bacterium]
MQVVLKTREPTGVDLAHIASNTIKANQLKGDAHWQWLSLGWADMKHSMPASIKIGGAVVVISLAIIAGLYFSKLGSLIPAAIGSFALAGPILATLVYGISRKLEDSREVKKLRSVDMRPKSPAQVAMIGFALLFLVLVWARIALLLYAVSTGLNNQMNEVDFIRFVLSTPQGLAMMAVGTIMGGVLALAGFAISAISIPLAFDRDVDALSAMAASFAAVAKNPMATLSWGFVISMMVGFSAIFAFLPLVVVFPWLGHATWHAYRDLVE